MRIGELARRSGVSVSRIRFYEDRGLLPTAPRQDNGYRSYGEDAVALLHFLDQAQRLGFSLAEIGRAKLGPGAAKPSPTIMIEALRRKEAEIDRLIDAATSKKHAIAALLDELHCTAQSGMDGSPNAPTFSEREPCKVREASSFLKHHPLTSSRPPR